MSKILTVEEFKNKEYDDVYWDENTAIDFAIEFAKLHVQEALKQASEKAEVIADDRQDFRLQSCNCLEYVIDKD